MAGVSSAERGVLRMVEKYKGAPKGMLSRKMAVSTDYIERICSSLVKDGLIEETPTGGYSLTSLGQKVLNPYTGFGLDRTAISNYPTPKAL